MDKFNDLKVDDDFEDTVPQITDEEMLEEIKFDDVVTMMTDMNFMQKLIVQKDLKLGTLYYLPQSGGGDPIGNVSNTYTDGK